jgi:hypothetical protein
LWAVNGLTVTTGAAVSGQVVLVPDGAGGAIALWVDGRSGNYDVLYAQRVNGSGVAQWAAGGLAFSSGGSNFSAPQRYNLNAVADGLGGAVICWEQYIVSRFSTTPAQVLVQRIDSAGAQQWGTGVAVSTTATDQTDPGIIRGDLAEAIVTWSEARSGASYVFAQRFNVVGVAQWTANGVFCSSSGSTQPNIVPDGAGGGIIAFSWSGNIGAKRILSNGVATWGPGFGLPVSVCIAAGSQYTPELVSDGAGGAVVVWHDERNPGSSVDLFAQRLNGSGAPQWTADGVNVVFAPSSQANPRLVSDGASGAVVAWTDFRSLVNYDIYAGRIRSDGTVAPWNGAALSTALDTQYEPALAVDGRGGAIVAWHDWRKGDPDIYAQRLDAMGFPGDPSPRITSVTDVPNDQGGKVRVSWTAGYVDDEFAPASLTYEVWRKPVITGGWVLVGTVPRASLAAYSFLAPTLADSGSALAPALFRVDQRWGPNPGDPFWSSDPDTGYSVDNLVPQPPSALSGSYIEGMTALTWSAGSESDLAGYRIYRGEYPGFTIGPEALVGETASSHYEDPAGAPRAYQVTTIDRNGNESAPAAWAPQGLSVPGDGGAFRLTLAAPRPNPARTSARLEFSLPRAGVARLIVTDVSGRRVRELAARHFEAGAHAATWDLRDAAGVRVAAGLYFVRLDAASGALVTRSVAVVR